MNEGKQMHIHIRMVGSWHGMMVAHLLLFEVFAKQEFAGTLCGCGENLGS